VRMCGINGFNWDDVSLVKQMNAKISYRGPDDTGAYSDSEITLGHNRLSIIDLSKKGHQPMTDLDGKLCITYNGEIYNYRNIRKELEKKGYKFTSNTDTEVIIYTYKEYGADCVKKFNGMFAFAIWDSEKKELFCARDRLGIKPLYYYHDQSRFIFSSEIKAILCHDLQKNLDRSALGSYLAYRFIPSDKTILTGIKKLQPGHTMTYSNNKLSIKRFWNISWNETKISEQDAVSKIKQLLSESVNKRLMSDVPLGAFLSGGLDSSLIVAMNSALRTDKVKTFTVGFDHESDEFAPAKKVADHLNTDHHELHLGYDKITKMLPKIVWYMDEPNSDPSMVPQYFLSEFAKKQVTVVNTGEGADELFSGYYHYRIGNSFNMVPGLVKKQIYDWYYSPFKKKDRKVLGFSVDPALREQLNKPNALLNNILHFDIKHELPNWQLARVDRMTMAHSMEARVPFLDHNMVQFATQLPVNLRQRGIDGKYILKKMALDYLPKNIVTRKKQGFTTPLHSWLKSEIEPIAEDMLLNRDIISKDYVKKLINKHKSAKKPRPFQLYSYQLFILVCLEHWFRQYLD